MAFKGVEIDLCVGVDRTELERFEDAGFTVEAVETVAAAAPAPAPVNESVETPVSAAAAAVDTSVEAAAQASSSGDEAATTSVAAAQEAAAASSTQQNLDQWNEAAPMAALGVDASAEFDSAVAGGY
eukprot:COSAG02_NODE_15738_length_1145_cov_1.064054_2_plen_126_part_01